MPELVPVGRVGKSHGLDGGFFVDGASGREAVFAEGAVLYAGGEPATVVRSCHGSGGRPVIRLDREVERGAELAVARATLPELEGEDEFYVFQLVGLRVEEEGGRQLGRVREVLEYPANDVLELDSGASLPLVEACVRKVDPAGGRIVVAVGFADPEEPSPCA
ncbi:MAG TPA: ribosome maturation factor RimM [Gaiellaceae bacterium]|nr:ribosome maturation factor RimM [Gaiellaceae bacterium]